MVSCKALYDDIQVALLMGRIRQACHYGSLVIKEVTERFVLMVKG